MEGKNDALREEEHGGKEMGAWLLRKAHLAARHGDTGWSGGARRIDLKMRGGHIEGNKKGKDGALREEKCGGKRDGCVALEKKKSTSARGMAKVAGAFAVARGMKTRKWGGRRRERTRRRTRH